MIRVITAKEAREITGGRTPLVPVEYEEAIKALVKCRSIEEAKYWDNKADALAAWAKIYRNDAAVREARALKLWAYRRMYELAKELRPRRSLGWANGRNLGVAPGPRSLLMENGLSKEQAISAASLAHLPKERIEELAQLPRPPSPMTVRQKRIHGSDSYRALRGTPPSLGGFVSFCRNHDAGGLARTLNPDEVARCAALAKVAIEWLDEFEQHLSKKVHP